MSCLLPGEGTLIERAITFLGDTPLPSEGKEPDVDETDPDLAGVEAFLSDDGASTCSGGNSTAGSEADDSEWEDEGDDGGVVIIMSVTWQYQSECQCPRYKTEQ